MTRDHAGFKHFEFYAFPVSNLQKTDSAVPAADFEHNCPAWLERGHQFFLGLQREPSLKQ